MNGSPVQSKRLLLANIPNSRANAQENQETAISNLRVRSRGALTRARGGKGGGTWPLEARKSTQNKPIWLNLIWLAPSRYPLQLRWRPLAAAEAALAAPRAAGMPVRWPRRPCAVSAAVAAGAGPDFSCAGELEPADRPAIRGKCALGWVCRPSLWVWWSSLVGGSISLLGLCLLGSSVRAGALGFVGSRNRILSPNFFASGGQSAAVFVRVCQHDSFVKSIPCSLVPFSRSISIWLA